VRVLLDYRAALRERSGVGEYAHELAAALLQACAGERNAGRVVDLSLFSSSWKDRVSRDARLAEAAVVDRRVPVRVLNFAWHRLGWPPAEALAGAGFDVVHSLHPLLMPARAAAQVITIHDLNFLSHPERTRAEVRRDYAALARQHAHRADRVVVVSQFTANEVTRLLDVDPARITVASPGAPAWQPRGTAPANGYVLFLGTLEPRKNVGALLDAYAWLAERRTLPKLVLAGKATDESRPWLDRLARPPLAGLVEHIGYVQPGQRRSLYEGAALLVQPSFEEGFGLPVLEAMTVGVPVVAANRGALPEVLGPAGLLVDPADREAMGAAIARFLDSPTSAAEASVRGRERAAAFSWAHTADRTIKAYDAAIARRAQRRAA
jgi:glycosyltransferase involved in cell wall biosynthesis